MNFLQRLTLLLHFGGFLAGVIAFPLMVLGFVNGVDLDEGLMTAILFTFIAPSTGWGLRWLIAGELASFMPFQHELIASLPKDGNFGAAFISIFIISSLLFYSIEYKESKESWEQKVFGSKCINQYGDETVLGYFKAPEGSEQGDPFYCSDYLESTEWGTGTLCTWEDAANAETWRCKALTENPKPTLDWEEIIPPVTFINLLVFYFLILIRLIYNLRTQSL